MLFDIIKFVDCFLYIFYIYFNININITLNNSYYLGRCSDSGTDILPLRTLLVSEALEGPPFVF